MATYDAKLIKASRFLQEVIEKKHTNASIITNLERKIIRTVLSCNPQTDKEPPISLTSFAKINVERTNVLNGIAEAYKRLKVGHEADETKNRKQQDTILEKNKRIQEQDVKIWEQQRKLRDQEKKIREQEKRIREREEKIKELESNPSEECVNTLTSGLSAARNEIRRQQEVIQSLSETNRSLEGALKGGVDRSGLNGKWMESWKGDDQEFEN
ncbi:hypothetical protein HYFRA_00011022 [Hymenoscyphus fraxineus]|uniref:Uncharacterized protein n=1 Tax=Hymenoscyphus fraxineus TaxID=746836 RepID=A0A9N9L199_9HELO|nr:hypothetical protein HYFRA_00011022 [Hymenoscyphus fraxineus]